MMMKVRSPLLNSLLFMNAAALAALFVAQFWPRPELENTYLDGSIAQFADAAPVTSQQNIAQVKERPLFHHNRRRPVVSVSDKQEPQVRHREVPFALAGILGSSATGHTAYLQNQQTQETVSVRAGETLEGWRVMAVNDREIVIEADGLTKTLTLDDGGN